MYIVAIGWLYVTLLLAASEPSLVAATVSFLFYGLLPCALLLWLGGTRARRQRRRLLADQRAHERDAADPQSDQ
jgi:hypothetical protein